MHIETKRLVIRTFQIADIDALEKIKYDPEVVHFIPDFIERGADRERFLKAILDFQAIEKRGDWDAWRLYAIEARDTGCVVGSLSFGKSEMLYEYELGWQMQSCFSGKGYASEAAEAFSEYFCKEQGTDYLIAIMDTDNPASYRTAEKSGFKLFEKRTVHDPSCGKFFDDYYYFRRYFSGSKIAYKFYGDAPYTGRGAEPGDL